MSHHVGVIHVEAGEGWDQGDLVAAITAYRKKQGARVDARSPLELEPMTLEDGGARGRLGHAVSPAKKGFYAVLDTEQVSADYALAEHIAKALGTAVAWSTLWGATSEGAARLLGRWKRKAPKDTYDDVWEFTSALPFGQTTFEDLQSAKARKGWAIVAFDRVPSAKYRMAPPAPKKKAAAKTKSAPAKKKAAAPKKTNAAPAPKPMSLDQRVVAIEEAFAEGRHEAALALAEPLAAIDDRFEALQDVCDYAKSFSVDLSAPKACAVVLALAKGVVDARKITAARAVFIKKRRSMSEANVAVAYLTAAIAAAWAEDRKTFEAILRAVDAPSDATRSYAQKGAEALGKKRPAYAAALAAHAGAP